MAKNGKNKWLEQIISPLIPTTPTLFMLGIVLFATCVVIEFRHLTLGKRQSKISQIIKWRKLHHEICVLTRGNDLHFKRLNPLNETRSFRLFWSHFTMISPRAMQFVESYDLIATPSTLVNNLKIVIYTYCVSIKCFFIVKGNSLQFQSKILTIVKRNIAIGGAHAIFVALLGFASRMSFLQKLRPIGSLDAEHKDCFVQSADVEKYPKDFAKSGAGHKKQDFQKITSPIEK
jgi:hypothetical protein